MGRIINSLIWAGAIPAAAPISSFIELSHGASFGIIAGLSAAAVGALGPDRSCGLRGCLQ